MLPYTNKNVVNGIYYVHFAYEKIKGRMLCPALPEQKVEEMEYKTGPLNPRICLVKGKANMYILKKRKIK